MTTWTPTARQELENHLAGLRRSLDGSGADPDEVLDDVRRHVVEEVTAARLPVVTEADVRRCLDRVAPLDRAAAAWSRPAPSPAAGPDRAAGPEAGPGSGTGASLGAWIRGLALGFFGVVLPLFTIGFEWMTRACAQEFFDPLPTFGHGLLVALVPVANLLMLVRPATPTRGALRFRWLLGSAALGVGTAYTLLFMPLAPFAAIGIVFGLGLMPLSPLFALISGIVLRRRIARELGGFPADWRWQGWAAWAAPLVLLAGLVVPGLATRRLSERAADPDPARSASAISALRSWASRDLLLRDCYGYRPGLWDWMLPDRPGVEVARQTWFRVTGEPFNAVPPPKSARSRQNRMFFEEFDFGGVEWDSSLGGEAVAGRVRGLSLVSSRLDAVADADAAWAYTEWTMEFRNDHERSQREARAQIQLPPGGVVSRLTLWVNGEEREAAFAGRSQVREAYQKVAIQQRRDPVLVTTAGPDRVLMQCFPVPPNGGTMKVRLGISAPLTLVGADRAALAWPMLLERNFAVGRMFTHGLWLDSPQAPANPPNDLAVSVDDQGRSGLHGEWTDATLSSPGRSIFLRRNPAVSTAWAPDRRSPVPGLVRQRLERSTHPTPPRLALVLDASRGMDREFAGVAAALKDVPAGAELALFVARDGVLRVEPEARTVEAVAGAIRELHAEGGQDAVPALVQAWEWAAAMPGSAVIWVHGPHPVLLMSPEPLRQRFERRRDAGAPRFLELPTRAGPNRVLEKLDGLEAVHSVPRLGSLTDDLGRCLAILGGREPVWTAVRERVDGEPGSSETAPAASTHLTRLWASGEVIRLWRERKVDEAVELAGRQQLVTPVSGAVVLETRQQFEQAGLRAVDPSTVPLVPEPGVASLLGLGLGILFLRRRRRRPSGCRPGN